MRYVHPSPEGVAPAAKVLGKLNRTEMENLGEVEVEHLRKTAEKSPQIPHSTSIKLNYDWVKPLIPNGEP
jgi:hypothetical protein